MNKSLIHPENSSTKNTAPPLYEPEYVCEEDLCVLFDPRGRIWSGINRFAGLLLQNPVEGQDVAQETCTRVLLAIRSGVQISPKSLYSYCHTTAYRLAINRSKAQAQIAQHLEKREIDGADSRKELSSGEFLDNIPDAKAPCLEMRTALREALNRLPRRDGELIQAMLLGYDDREIATLLNMSSPNNVRQVRYRAIRKLRDLLQVDVSLPAYEAKTLTKKEGAL